MKSKFIVSILSALFAFGALIGLAPMSAHAAMDNTAVSISCAGTAVTTGNISVIRGELRAVRVSVASGITGAVVAASSAGTVLNLSAHTGTAIYFPRVAAQGITGVAVATNSFVAFPLASTVTSVITQVNSTTNTWTVEYIYDR